MNSYKSKNFSSFLLFLLLNPTLVWLYLTKKAYLPVYVQYEWLKKYNIKTMIDVGTFTGNEIHTASILFPDIKIYAFEPIQSLHKNILSKIKSKKLEISEYLVGDKNKQVKFYIDPSNDYLSSSIKIKNSETISKKMVTLDSFFKNKDLKPLVFLKIDTQGTEYEVLIGAKNILKKVFAIHIETSYVNADTFEKIYSFLSKNDFIYAGEATESYFYPKFGPKSGANSLFVNKKVLKDTKFFGI